MGAFIDLTGAQYDRLHVLGPAPDIGERKAFLCECICGNKLAVTSNSLRTEKTRSCGCLNNEKRA